jgi:hypothetical protein
VGKGSSMSPRKLELIHAVKLTDPKEKIILDLNTGTVARPHDLASRIPIFFASDPGRWTKSTGREDREDAEADHHDRMLVKTIGF